MATQPQVELVMVDCSVVCKWKLVAEPQALEASKVLLDWQAGCVELCAPELLPAEIMSTFLKATRMGRLSQSEAKAAIRELVVLPIRLLEIKPIVERAFEIAQRYQQRSYDCLYVALAEHERINLWTSDEQLYNALNGSLPFICFLANYQPKRQSS